MQVSKTFRSKVTPARAPCGSWPWVDGRSCRGSSRVELELGHNDRRSIARVSSETRWTITWCSAFARMAVRFLEVERRSWRCGRSGGDRPADARGCRAWAQGPALYA